MKKYSHLYINQISKNDRKRKIPPKNIPGLSRSEHGQLLTTGINRIFESYKKVVSTKANGLDSKGIVTFKVILQKGEKIDNSTRRTFLERQGFTIHAIKNNREVIVTSPVDNFPLVQKKMSEYINVGKHNDFQYIENFGRILPREKMSYEFIQEIEKERGNIDSQVMLLPNLSSKVLDDMIDNVQHLINEYGGQVLSNPLLLTDGTPIIRANMSGSVVEKIAEEDSVFRIEETTIFSDLVVSSIPKETFPALSLDSKVDVSLLPIVTVLDSGVNLPPMFDSLVIEHCDFTGLGKPSSEHGTEVSSRVIFENLGDQIRTGVLFPRARVIDCRVISGVENSFEILKRIQKAVDKYYLVSQIFNISINEVDHCISDDQVSVFGYELDKLSEKYGVQFVVSAGNHVAWKTGATLVDCINDAKSRICSPAESFNAITVGAVSNFDQSKDDFYKKFLTKYSRRGPGFANTRKPDVVGIAGSIYFDPIAQKGRLFEESGAYVLGFNGTPVIDAGTSFSAPEAAGTLSSIYSSLSVFKDSRDRILLAKTLLLHGAEKLTVPLALQAHLKYPDYYLFGCGLVDSERSLFSNEKNATFFTFGKIRKGEKIIIPFHIPSVLETSVIGKDKVRVKLTCSSWAPTNKAAGPNYLEEFLNVSLHKNTRTGGKNNGNPDLRESFRMKWMQYIQYENSFTNFSSGEWQIWIELSDRANHDKNEWVRFSLAVSVVEQKGNFDIYSEILKETANLYIPLTTLIQERSKIKI